MTTTDHAKDAKHAVLCHFNLPQRLSKATNGSNSLSFEPFYSHILNIFRGGLPSACRRAFHKNVHRVYSTVAGAIAIGHKAEPVPCSSQFTLLSLVPDTITCESVR